LEKAVANWKTKLPVPVVTLVRSKDSVFGGFATQPWEIQDGCYGQPGCFLFNITANTKIPYHGRCAGKGRSIDGKFVAVTKDKR
jgi:hypothetical protein